MKDGIPDVPLRKEIRLKEKLYGNVVRCKIMDPRNANFEHSFPECSNCNVLFAPDDLDLETMLCVECSHEFESVTYENEQYNQND